MQRSSNCDLILKPYLEIFLTFISLCSSFKKQSRKYVACNYQNGWPKTSPLKLTAIYPLQQYSVIAVDCAVAAASQQKSKPFLLFYATSILEERPAKALDCKIGFPYCVDTTQLLKIVSHQLLNELPTNHTTHYSETKQYYIAQQRRCNLSQFCPLLRQEEKSKMAVSKIRTNFHAQSEALINKQINMELHASYVYMSMVRD